MSEVDNHDSAADGLPSLPAVNILRPDGRERHRTLREGTWTIGRAEEADIALKDNKASRIHAEFRVTASKALSLSVPLSV